MRDFLLKQKKKKEERAKELRSLIEKSESVTEVRSKGQELAELTDEIKELDEKISEIDELEAGEGTNDDNQPAIAPAVNTSNPDVRGGFNPMSAYGTRSLGNFTQNGGAQANNQAEETSVYGTIEYRQAFKSFIQTGDASALNAIESRADVPITSADVGAVIPETVMNTIIEKLETYGQIYNRVTRTSVQGGVAYPIGNFVAPRIKWIGEGQRSDNQPGVDLKEKLMFAYNVGELRMAHSILADVVTLSVFENKVAALMVEGYVRSTEEYVWSGTGTGQPLGILNDTRVPAENKITFNDAEMADWAAIQSKFFAQIPLAYESGVIYMTKPTWEGKIKTLRDDANRPLWSEVVGGTTTKRTYNGYEVELVEPGAIKNYSTAAEGEVFMVFADLKNYVINENMKIRMMKYYDHDTNEVVNKGLCIVDGKLVIPFGVFIMKKTLLGTMGATMTSQQLLAERNAGREKANEEAKAIVDEAVKQAELIVNEAIQKAAETSGTMMQEFEEMKQSLDAANQVTEDLKKEFETAKKNHKKELEAAKKGN